ncbi:MULTISPECIES: 3-hydroxyacyl-CoA dehydrogenase NAD-binding domain-containing protein [Rhodanobacter]|uniref:3-hydroxyacyl-CoA dehydrogenase NAD-binding domain-containing protein n=1 Tax=Rhodanobacter TaxID=75309 RepID=UPI000412CA6D|nr:MULTISPECIES: 3-hydroxyacyl-CoA dehydrogenase NAD-binding domain-containing protein [Rhodanobacter]KZC20562.1 3-hydroxyacyl-CoA dehydrogenase [Rhodanobacter denitrificans]UJJ49541.1 3-hydroxyacyl-CoA dehydrogenase NAD-binding domain-containing protein [Rhodanobacter denitrificans]UJJ58257.1 3-hydroxyacyl-CoA dehydrogenase NAD-binding domain-containing protein [Rhodanobacter denitrificans]UJM92255.1 3-hydroxyacyl-CoA dehydrogenase NAD-binding domain-containing protein [Rhodanobacter denitrifi
MFEGLRFNHWKTSQGDDGVVTLTLDRADSSVNAISRAVLDELEQIVERLAIDKPAGVIVHSAKSSGFAVGADVKEFIEYAKHDSVLENIEHGQRVYEALARLPCPTVAAVHGACMGGGTELILACRQRIAADDERTRIALPEVMLGIHPGWGGTARLPRLIGATEALPLMLTGKSLSAKRALGLGVVDRLARADELLAEAKLLLRHPASRPFARRARAWASNTWLARQILAPMVFKQTAAKVRKEHYPAPFAMIDVWKRGGSAIQQRLKLEARSVAKLAQTPTAQNLIRIFFLQERLKGQGGGIEHGIKHVHVVGAGVMGGDIAAWAALKGFEVTLQDREMKFVQPALDRARALYEKKLKAPEKVEVAMRRLRADVEGSGVASADLAIEAIYENARAKEALYAGIEPQFQADEILASNTSSIPLDELRKNLAAPQRFLGLHFFNPVAQMPLVEVVRHDRLDPAIEKRALAFCKAIGKLPVAVKGTPGFLVNRILMPYLLEAMRLYSEGVPGPVLDREAKKFGMPMGPIELADTVGLDVCASVGKELAPFLGLEVPPGLDEKLAAGKRGKKDGQGLYVWQDGKPQKPEIDKDYVTPPDVQERMILPMVNEAIACLADGVVDDADLLDAGVIFGTGFAPFRGGPIQYTRSEGADKLKARLEQLAQRYGDRFKPKHGWELPALAQRGFGLPAASAD